MYASCLDQGKGGGSGALKPTNTVKGHGAAWRGGECEEWCLRSQELEKGSEGGGRGRKVARKGVLMWSLTQIKFQGWRAGESCRR